MRIKKQGKEGVKREGKTDLSRSKVPRRRCGNNHSEAPGPPSNSGRRSCKGRVGHTRCSGPSHALPGSREESRGVRQEEWKTGTDEFFFSAYKPEERKEYNGRWKWKIQDECAFSYNKRSRLTYTKDCK